jgi:hypothetical protein
LTVTPTQGQSTLTATVTLDPASARFLTRTPTGCPNLLEIDGVATLDLPEGKVADQQPLTISASADMAPVAIALRIEEEDFGPWVSIRKADPNSTLSMSISVNAIGRACSGYVSLSSQTVGNGVGGGVGGTLASWSDKAGPTD